MRHASPSPTTAHPTAPTPGCLGCHDCHAKQFLGTACAWPARRCAHKAEARQRPYTAWRRRVATAALTLGLCLGVWQVGHAGYIHAKAWLAQVLIAQAWADTLAGATQARPWGWADTWPVARLSAPKLNETVYVLAGSDNRTIAFGPGHVFGTPLPGETGNSVIGAHRDTHFAFLQWLDDGDEIEVQTARGTASRYRIVRRTVVDKGDVHVMRQPEHGGRQLTLITCWPFDALTAGGPLRYVVTAEAVDGAPRVAATAPTATGQTL